MKEIKEQNLNHKVIYRIYGNSRKNGWEELQPEYTESAAIESAEDLDPLKYYNYQIVGYDLTTNEPIFLHSRYLDYDKPKTLVKEFNPNVRRI